MEKEKIGFNKKPVCGVTKQVTPLVHSFHFIRWICYAIVRMIPSNERLLSEYFVSNFEQTCFILIAPTQTRDHVGVV